MKEEVEVMNVKAAEFVPKSVGVSGGGDVTVPPPPPDDGDESSSDDSDMPPPPPNYMQANESQSQFMVSSQLEVMNSQLEVGDSSDEDVMGMMQPRSIDDDE